MRAPPRLPLTSLFTALVVSACGGAGGGDGPRVADAAQSISFGATPSLQVAGTATVQASASSGLPVSFSSQTPTVCAVDSTNGTVTGLAIGACSIGASQGGNDRFAPAPRATLSFTVGGRGQTIGFDPAPALTVGDSAGVRAGASSGLPVRYTSLTPATCSVLADTGAVTGYAAGACTIAADQAGDAQWAAAAQATQGLDVALRAQTLQLAELPALLVGGSITAQASASSGLPVSFASLTPDVCGIHATSGVVTTTSAGTCAIVADQPGDARWAPATQVRQATVVTRVIQSIQFASLPNGLTVGSSVTVVASAGSGLPVSFASLSTGICSVDAARGVVTGLTIGTCVVAASQGGNATWSPAVTASTMLPVGGMAQTLSFGAAPALTAGGTALVSAWASSGLPVGYASLTPASCSVSAAGLVSSLAAGTCTVVANQPGDARWAAATPATLTLSAASAGQTISFGTAPALTVNTTSTASATASSGLAVVYSSLTPAQCSVNASSGAVTGLSVGTCTLAANQSGNAIWAPAPQATQSASVAGMAQTISFAAAPPLSAGGTATVRATASSGLAVAYGSLSPTLCTVQATSGLVTSLAAGACTIAASQPGNSVWAAAPQAVQTLGVSLAPQTISFAAAPAALTVGGTATVRASASSGLAVGYSSLSAAVCSVGAASGSVTALSIGTCTVAAGQGGDAVWAPAAQVTQSFAVAGMAQTISFGSAPVLTVGGSASVRATASSGLAVSHTSLTPAVCSVQAVSGLVSALAAGSCSIAADQPGNSSWAAAAQAVQTFAVTVAPQTIAFASAPALVVGSTARVRATASSGLGVSYSSLTADTCSVIPNDGTVTGLAIGPCTIAANQAGNAAWAPAPQATLGLTVSGLTQSIAFGAAPALTVGGVATVRAVASSGLAVAYSSLTPAVCTVLQASGVVTGLVTGTCRIAADQPGNSTWSAAAQATQALTVAPNPNQTLSFAAAPTLTLGGTATVRATASSGLAVIYSSLSGTVCSVNGTSGLVTGLTLGDCVIAANQPGDASYFPAPQVTQTLPVQVPLGMSTPGAPQGVAARLGNNVATVVVSIGSVNSGGLPITGYTVSSQPAGITVASASMPVTVSCPSSCAGYAFSVAASNAIGTGTASASVEVLTTFDVLTTFREPDTQPRDSIFTGSFVLNSTTGAISALTGQLTESMSGNAIGSAPYFDMTQVPLTYQLRNWTDATLGGTFVAAFAKNTTSTFSTLLGGDGWSPAAGVAIGGIYAGFPAAYANSVQNSYILIFVPDNPFAALTQAQIDKLAYADCAPGGMMGAVCMTATSVAGYGAIGTMSGYPVSQVIVRR